MTRSFPTQRLFVLVLIAIGGALSTAMTPATEQPAAAPATAPCAPALDFEKRRLASDDSVRLCDAYRGQVVLIVNTASKCGFTGQYEGLEALYDRYRERGFVVLGFPSNDFANQEPGDERQIQEFCRLTYSVEFPMFEKVHVRGAQADPLFRHLAEQTGAAPKWNFYKYLIDREGKVVDYFASMTGPDSRRMVKAIEALL